MADLQKQCLYFHVLLQSQEECIHSAWNAENGFRDNSMGKTWPVEWLSQYQFGEIEDYELSGHSITSCADENVKNVCKIITIDKWSNILNNKDHAVNTAAFIIKPVFVFI